MSVHFDFELQAKMEKFEKTNSDVDIIRLIFV